MSLCSKPGPHMRQQQRGDMCVLQFNGGPVNMASHLTQLNLPNSIMARWLAMVAAWACCVIGSLCTCSGWQNPSQHFRAAGQLDHEYAQTEGSRRATNCQSSTILAAWTLAWASASTALPRVVMPITCTARPNLPALGCKMAAAPRTHPAERAELELPSLGRGSRLVAAARASH